MTIDLKQLTWWDKGHPNAKHDQSSVWSFDSLFRRRFLQNIQSDFNLPSLHQDDQMFNVEGIQLNTQGKYMRLSKNERDTMSFSKLRLFATSKDKNGYNNPLQTMWTIKLEEAPKAKANDKKKDGKAKK